MINDKPAKTLLWKASRPRPLPNILKPYLVILQTMVIEDVTMNIISPRAPATTSPHVLLSQVLGPKKKTVRL